jgi:hypothetical protein
MCLSSIRRNKTRQLYRTCVLWERDRRVLVPLTLLYLTSIGCGVLAELSCLNDTLYQISAPMHVATYSTSVALNLLTTLAIATRLWHMRRQYLVVATGAERRVMGVLAVLVESAALYAVIGIALIPAYIVGSPVATVLSALFQGIAVRHVARRQCQRSSSCPGSESCGDHPSCCSGSLLRE